VAEWLCSGLQSRVRRFDSDPRLHFGNDLSCPACADLVARRHWRIPLLRSPASKLRKIYRSARMVKLVDTRDLKSLGPLTRPCRFDPGSGHQMNYHLPRDAARRGCQAERRELKLPAFHEHVAATVSSVLSRGRRTLLRASCDYVVSAVTTKFLRLCVAVPPTLRSPGAIDTVAHGPVWQTNVIYRSAARKGSHNYQKHYAHGCESQSLKTLAQFGQQEESTSGRSI
jgi:hypothetical protein